MISSDPHKNEAGLEPDMASTSGRVTIVVPAFNERHSLEQVLPGWLGWCEANDAMLIVVDDGSDDDTDKFLGTQAAHPALRAYRHRSNRGYGAALKTGIHSAETEFIGTMDADGQHNIEDFSRLLDAFTLQGADLVIGARSPGLTRDRYRRLGKAIIRGLANILFSTRIRDLNSGMKLFRRTTVQRLLPLCPNSMAFSEVITLVHLNADCHVVETTIETMPRAAGFSTIGTMTALETTSEIVNVVMGFKPLRVFVPIAAGLFLLGIFWAVPFLVAGRGLSSVALLLILSSGSVAILGLLAEQLASMRRIYLPEAGTKEITDQ